MQIGGILGAARIPCRPGARTADRRGLAAAPLLDPDMPHNPLIRHVALFLLVKAVLIGLGLWWFMAALPEPRGAVAPPAAAARPS